MPSFKQLALKQLAILGLTATLLAGCDGASPDSDARAKMNAGRIAAAKGDEEGRSEAKTMLTQAASTPGVSTASSAQAHATLGQVQYDAGLEMLRDADRKELAASRIALQIAALGSQLGNSATLVQGYQKLDPAPSKTQISNQIAQVKGAPDKPTWTASEQAKINVTSQSAAEQEVSRIQGEIAKRQSQIKDLDDQRVAALKEADEAMKASEAAKGRESVDQYKKYSDAKKKAADFQTQIDMLNGQLMPLQKDLEIAVGQQQIMQIAVTELENESKTLDEGWKDIQSKIAAQTDLITQIAAAPAEASTQPSASPSASGKSITAKAIILAQTVKEAQESRDKASEALEQAIAEFDKACTEANSAGREMSEQGLEQSAVKSVADIAREVISVQVYKLRLATAERVLGEMQLSKAAGISSRIKLREMLTPLMAQAQQTMPRELADTTLDAQLKETLGNSAKSFDDASNHLADIIDGPGADSISTSTKKAASISKIFLLYNQQQLALLKGDKAGADKAHADAVTAVKAAADLQASFPTLPGDLAAAIPPPPAAAPAETPATSPAEGAATAPTAAAEDSPEVQAIRAVTTSFLDALAKGDMDGAKAFTQIDPGQEALYNQMVTLLSDSLKFQAALKDKFPDQATALAAMDPAVQMKNQKITVKGEEAFAQMPGQPEKKSYVKAGDQWKVYFGPLTPTEQANMPMVQKLAAVLPTITADVQAGKYATIQDVQKAFMVAMGIAPPAAPAPAP
jgi:hypothetical protein